MVAPRLDESISDKVLAGERITSEEARELYYAPLEELGQLANYRRNLAKRAAFSGNGEQVVTGDFNGDGKADLIVELSGFAQLAFFAGNGDGTFQAPVIENISFPSGQIFAGEEMIVADYTGDGKVDLITVGSAALLRDIVLLPGEGNGQFGTAKVVYTAPADHGPGWSIHAGDFDADGKALTLHSAKAQAAIRVDAARAPCTSSMATEPATSPPLRRSTHPAMSSSSIPET